ncbi:MAG: sigma-70 family RNA polymerase sigma factor [Planctomycetota bacterium]
MTSGDLDDADFERLTRAAADGDRAAIDALLERMLPDLRAYVRLRTGPLIRRHEAQSDIVQSICREILTHADRFQHPTEGAFRRWLFTTALRKLSNRRDHLIAERRDVGRHESDRTSDIALLAAYARVATPSQHAAVREDLERVEAAMETLNEQERSLIVLSRIVGCSRADIAEEMGLTPGAVRMRLHRALAKLAIALGEDDGELGAIAD